MPPMMLGLDPMTSTDSLTPERRAQLKKAMAGATSSYLRQLRTIPGNEFVDEIISEVLDEREREEKIEKLGGANFIRTKLVTQIKHKPEPPSQDDLDFWDVMDEEYESVMKWFEDPKDAGSVDQGRPVGPDPAFWIDQYLSAPLAEDSAYFDPIPSDQLGPRFVSAVSQLLPGNMDSPVFKTKLRASGKFQDLDLRHQQQALRWIENLRDGKIPPAMQERMQQAELIEKVIINAGVEPGSEQHRNVASAFFKSSDADRKIYLDGWKGPTRTSPGPAIDDRAWCEQVVRNIERDADRRELIDHIKKAEAQIQMARQGKQAAGAVAPPKGPSLRDIMQQAVKDTQKRQLWAKR